MTVHNQRLPRIEKQKSVGCDYSKQGLDFLFLFSVKVFWLIPVSSVFPVVFVVQMSAAAFKFSLRFLQSFLCDAVLLVLLHFSHIWLSSRFFLFMCYLSCLFFFTQTIYFTLFLCCGLAAYLAISFPPSPTPLCFLMTTSLFHLLFTGLHLSCMSSHEGYSDSSSFIFKQSEKSHFRRTLYLSECS